MRVVIADDSLLVREGLTRILAAHGIDVAGAAGDGAELDDLVRRAEPAVAIVDIRMPPSFSTEGIDCASALARTHPDLAVLVLSQHIELTYARSLVEGAHGRRGYLLKDRVLDADHLVGTLYRIAAGDTVVDPEVVAAALATPAAARRLQALTAREREVLALLAEGLTDRGICDRLVVSPRTVATHVQSIFAKLGLPDGPAANRRVHAVLAYIAPE